MKKLILILLTALLFACCECEKEELNTSGGGRMNYPECPPRK